MPPGIAATMPCSGTHTSSACAPNLGLYPNTRSPTEKFVTPGPTDSTTPANSLPRIVARGWTRPVNARMKNGFAARVPQSVRFTVVAWTATRNSLGPTTGAGTSLIRTTSGGPYLVRTAALMPRHPSRSGPELFRDKLRGYVVDIWVSRTWCWSRTGRAGRARFDRRAVAPPGVQLDG